MCLESVKSSCECVHVFNVQICTVSAFCCPLMILCVHNISMKYITMIIIDDNEFV